MKLLLIFFAAVLCVFAADMTYVPHDKVAASLAKRIQAPPTPQLQPTFAQYRDMVRNAGTTTNAAAFAQQFSKLVAAVTPESARTALREISDRHWNIAARYLDWNHKTLWILLAALFAAGKIGIGLCASHNSHRG